MSHGWRDGSALQRGQEDGGSLPRKRDELRLLTSLTTELEIVGRLAPSPTGLLHLGHARTFLIAWLHVRSHGGTLRLRIEDLDGPRVRRDFIDAAAYDLEWLGLDWDGGVVLQSAGIERIEQAIEFLEKNGRLYPCVCSRTEIRATQSRLGVYAGTCRGRFVDIEEAERITQRPAGLRFLVPDEGLVFDDLICGQQQACLGDSGDFLVSRRDKVPSYQLAVVVDDAAFNVSHVIRGDDLVSSTPSQILLQRALSLKTPAYAHVPLVLDPTGRRYAKRHDALSLQALRRQGTDPRSIVEWVAATLGLPEVGRVGPEQLLRDFRLEAIPRDPVRLDEATLTRLKASGS